MRIISIFGRDFRLRDNPLFEGWQEHEIIPVFVVDKFNQNEHGDNLKTIFFAYLLDFAQKMKTLKSHLYIVRLEDIEDFIIRSRADYVRYAFDGEPNTHKRGNLIESICQKNKVRFISLWNFLIKPNERNFRLRFTDFYNKVFLPSLLSQDIQIVTTPTRLNTPRLIHKDEEIPSYNKQQNILNLWFKDEKEVIKSFEKFLSTGISLYQSNRDIPSVNGTSRLSTYLRHGIISPRTVYLMAKDHPDAGHFIRQIAWSEFYRLWIYNFPEVIDQEFNKGWIGFPWERESPLFDKWKEAETGFDIVDAGMLQLKEEGWIHNRVRMVVASFLTKNLLIDWRLGERFFYKNLVDGDLALNVGNWQWVAGCGLDSVPYTRIFNPDIQTKKFDPNGVYISKYLKERHPKIVDLYHSRYRFLKIVKTYQMNNRM
ncbi:MAG: deoxyribodipyrimidine photo-lyase [Thermodesulfovibrionales bacterium]